jgi:hypothetical protein
VREDGRGRDGGRRRCQHALERAAVSGVESRRGTGVSVTEFYAAHAAAALDLTPATVARYLRELEREGATPAAKR